MMGTPSKNADDRNKKQGREKCELYLEQSFTCGVKL
jgi:hypothetical protein